ncbi:MAG: hypothetical protein ACYTAN_08655, partial [Planctomycetota bacterium]
PVSVRVFDEDGRYVPGAKVRISGLMDTYRASPPDGPDPISDVRNRRTPVSVRSTTDENGVARLRFPDIQADVLVMAPGFAPGVEKGLVSLPRDKPLDVTIGRGVTLTGRVVDETGGAVSSVSLFCKRLVSIGSVGDFDERTSRSGEDGSFVFDDLAPGTYEVGPQPDGLGPSVCIQMARVSVAETSEPVTLVSRPAASITGRYVCSGNVNLARQPVGYSFDGYTAHETWPRADGSFTVSGLPVGSSGVVLFTSCGGYHLRVRASGGQDFLEVRGDDVFFEGLPAGSHGGIEVALLLEARVVGRLTDDKGDPVQGVTVHTRPAGRVDVTDRDGRYNVSCPPGLEARLVVRSGNPSRIILETEPFALAEGEVVEKNLVLSAGPPSALEESPQTGEEPNESLDLRAFRFDAEGSEVSLEGKAILVCFWDVDSRPSRRMVEGLATRSGGLAGKDVAVLLVHAGTADASNVRAYLNEKGVTSPLAFVNGGNDEMLPPWAIETLPRLVLADKEHTVRGAGFSISALDAELDKMEAPAP